MTDDKTALADLADVIMARREEACRKREVVRPQHVPRASSIGECDREMVLSMTHWQHKPIPDPWLSQRFQRGRDVETVVGRELSDIGLPVVQAQMANEVRDRDGTLLCTLHIDGRLEYSSLTPVFECKSLNPHAWGRVNAIEDFRRWPWARRYPRQLITYMYANDEPHGLMLLDDCLGHWKLLPIRLEQHFEECETILKRLRTVVDAKANETELPYCTDPTVCRDCWAFKAGVCFPPLKHGEGVTVLDDSELTELFEIVREHGAAAKEYQRAEKRIKEVFKARGAGQYLAGDWLVETRATTRKGFSVPDGTMVRTTWEDLGAT